MKIKIFLLLMWFVYSVQAQQSVQDSLFSVIEKTEDGKKAKLYNELASSYISSYPDSLLHFAEKAIVIAEKSNDNTEKAYAQINIGNANIIKGDYNQALRSFHDAKFLFENALKKDAKDYARKGLAKAYGSIGIVNSEQSNYTQAFDYYIKSIAIYEELQDSLTLSKLYNNVGVAYKSQNELDKALLYFDKAQKIQKKLKDENVGITLTNIANCYLSKNELDKAFAFYAEAQRYVVQDARALGEWYNNMGLYFQKKNDAVKALEQWDLAIAAFGKIEDKFGVSDTYLHRSRLLFQQQKYNEALRDAQKALQLANETQVPEQKAISQKILSDIYERQGDYAKSLQHHKLYTIINDSLINVQHIRESVQAEMNFEFDKKENERRLENEKAELLRIEQSKQQRNRWLFGTLGALLLMGLGFVLYSRSQLKKRLTLQKELAEYEQKALHLQMNPHFIFNCLGAISSFIIQNGTDHSIKYLAKFSKLMRMTLEYSKESLIPIEKEIESLQNYLELEKLRFNNSFDFTITKSDAIEDDVAIPPLLIQPIVENAIIHGIMTKKEKGNILIDFSLNENDIICTVTDNGIGIGVSKKMKEKSVQVHESMAMDIIRKRLKMITKLTEGSASLKTEQINNSEGDSLGTEIVISLPVQYKN